MTDFATTTPSPLETHLRADLAEALGLLDQLATWCPCPDEGQECANTKAHELLVRHGIRQAEGEPTACPDSSLLAWGLHLADPDGRWEA